MLKKTFSPKTSSKEFPIRTSIVSSVLALGLASLSMAQTPTIAGCSVLPANNVWNTPIEKMPVDKNSAAYIASMNVSKSTIYPVLNNTGWGMPYNVVPGSTVKVPVTFYYNGNDAGPYPIPSNVVIKMAVIITRSLSTPAIAFYMSCSISPAMRRLAGRRVRERSSPEFECAASRGMDLG